MSSKQTIKMLSKKIDSLINKKLLVVVVKNHPRDTEKNVLFLPQELTTKYGIITED